MNDENIKEHLEQEAGALPETIQEESPQPENTEAFLEKMRKQIGRGVFELQIKKPIRSGKKEITTLQFDLSEMGARDMIECEKQWEYQFGRTTSIPAQSSTYLLTIAAKSIGVPVDDLINNLNIKEATAICNCVTGFLMS